MLKSLELNGICQRCKDVIDWKVKFKKYKPLTVPKKCTKCSKKAVKQAYYIMCIPCATENNVCAKCGENTEVVSKPKPSQSQQMAEDSQLKAELQMLPERKRRKFLRLLEQGKLNEDALSNLKDSDSLDDDDFLDEEDDDDDDEDENDDECSDKEESEDLDPETLKSEQQQDDSNAQESIKDFENLCTV